MGKRGIQLDKRYFAKAIEKALAVKPRVNQIGSFYGVMQADQRTVATVHFTIWDGKIWATCTCKAHTLGDHDSGKPVPCYHIAAAALSKGSGHLINDLPQLFTHHHLCPTCGDAFDCACPTEHLNQTCQDCDLDAVAADDERRHHAIEERENAPLYKPSTPRNFISYTREGWDL